MTATGVDEEPASRETDALTVHNLTCEIETPTGLVRPVDNVSFRLGKGRTLGIVGESGAGKSMLARVVMGIAPRNATITGEVFFSGVDIAKLTKKQHREMLGAGVALIFQHPTASLSPVVSIGRQITDGMKFHHDVTKAEAKERAIELLTQVGISDPAKRFRQYPHQLSGGQCQRVAIAAALACDPDVLIADEATTALDVTVQKQILDLLKQIQADRKMALVIITHDLGIVAGRTDEIVVMYTGQVVEAGLTEDVFSHHRNQYTAALLRSLPRLEHPPHGKLATIGGTPPSLASLPIGCRFGPRCSAATPECAMADPVVVVESPVHRYKCIHPVEDGAATHTLPIALSSEGAL